MNFSCMSLIVLVVLETMLGPFGIAQDINFDEDGNLAVEYHRFVIFRQGINLVGVVLVPDPRYGMKGVKYLWFHEQTGADGFYGMEHESPEPFANPKLLVGNGEANERLGNYAEIHAGPVSVDWSARDRDRGWLFWLRLSDEIPRDLFVCTKQFGSLREFDEARETVQWISVFDAEEKRSGNNRVKVQERRVNNSQDGVGAEE